MILIVGPIASGKRTYACSLGYDAADMSTAMQDERPVLFEAQELVRDEDVDIEALARRCGAEKRVVICTEVGAGVVPIDAGERAWRDRAGAFMRLLAERSDAVVRMACGIPSALKGELPAGSASAECAAQRVSAQGATGLIPGSTETISASHRFFSNRACKYFPCHEDVDENEFNCLFCYCPLYALGPDCGGNFTYTEKGRKNCAKCSLPHRGEQGSRLISERYDQLADLAKC